MEKKKMTGYPSIDRPWLKYYSDKASESKIPSCTVYENIYQINKDHPNNIALEFFGKSITYGKMFEEIDRVATAFINYGITKNDKVILFTSSTPEIIIAILALGKIGAVANMISPLFTEDQIIARINETDAELMIAMEQLWTKVSDVLDKLCVKNIVVVSVLDSMPFLVKSLVRNKLKANINYSSKIAKWKSFIMQFGHPVGKFEDIYEKGQPLIMVYSSGTTGASKGIVLTNDGINATISHYISPDFPYKRGDRYLQIIPIWFSTGIVVSCLMPLCLGITVVLEPIFSAETFCRDVRKYKPTMTLVATSLWLPFLNDKKIQKMDLSFLKYPITGGEQLSPRVENTINTFLAERNCKSTILQGWGMCELGGTVCTNTMTHKKCGSTGFPIKGVIVAAFDMDTNQELQYNQRGELRVMSPARMKCYYKNEIATNEYFYEDKDGQIWGCTGDMGMLMKMEMCLYWAELATFLFHR